MADYQMSGKNYWKLFGRKIKQLKENSEHFNTNPKPRLPGEERGYGLTFP